MPQSDENEVRLPAPLDGVSAVRFDGSGEHLLVSSWDASLRLYDVQSATLRRSWTQPAPLLDAEFDGDGRAVSAGLDYAVRLHELERDTQRQLGQHDSAVRCVRWCKGANVLVRQKSHVHLSPVCHPICRPICHTPICAHFSRAMRFRLWRAAALGIAPSSSGTRARRRRVWARMRSLTRCTVCAREHVAPPTPPQCRHSSWSRLPGDT